jgi:hypothetical protein
MRIGDYEASEQLAVRALDLARRDSDPAEEARALTMLAVIAAGDSDHGRARALTDEALDAADRCGDRRRVAITLISAADIALTGEDFRRAAELADEALSLGAEALDPANRAIGLVNLATAEFRRGETDAALPPVREALGIVVELGELDLVAQSLELIAVIGPDARVSARLLGAAEALRAKFEAEPNPTERAVLETAEAELRHRLGEDAYEAARKEGLGLPTEVAVELAQTSLGRSAGAEI